MSHSGSSHRKTYAHASKARDGYSDGEYQASLHRQAIHHPRTSLGAAGHWIHFASVAAPLIIPELTKDPEKRWRYLRLASVGAAIASEAIWTHKLAQERKKDEACEAASHAER